MKRLLTCLVLTLFLFQSLAFAAPYRRRASDVYVQGYTRSNGTQVRSHYRSAPDNSTSNNYGSWDYSGGGGDNYSNSYNTYGNDSYSDNSYTYF